MKKSALLIALPGLIAVQGAFAQATHLKLSKEHPAAGDKISFTYDSVGTAIAGKGKLEAIVLFLDGKDYPAADISLKALGKTVTGMLTVPATAKAFFIKISAGTEVDSNNDKGYLYAVYKGAQPVEGAYAQEAFTLSSGMGQALAKIKTDMPAAIELYNKEFALYPKNLKDKAAFVPVLSRAKETAKVGPLTDELANSGDEKSMIAAANYYRTLIKNPGKADSLLASIKAKYPNGELAKNTAGLALTQEKDPAKKEALYAEFIKKYPEANEKKTIQDNYRVQVAGAYLAKGDLENYKRVAVTVKDQTNLAGALNNEAYELAKKGERLPEAEQLSKRSIDLTSQKMNEGMMYYSPSAAKKVLTYSYNTYSDTYSLILFKENKIAEAVKIEAPVYDEFKGVDAEVNGHYAMYLKAAGDTQKATEVIEAAIKSGKTTEDMSAELKELYTKTKGSDKDFDAYYGALKNVSSQAMRAQLAKEMINKAAPEFALKDFAGNTVSLASLKGKIVIVDFWATWCGPCKASFPGMQQAVNKFKDDANVKFVFIDTWENGDNYLDGVKKFIADNKYSFHVLMDEKTAEGKQAKVVTAFGVDGIPTKFIIDASGNIRFKHVGFSGSAGELVEEVSTMIEMAAHPDAVTTGEKVSYNKQ